ncbi:MAG: DUF502 domain-containing protein [Pirellulales bacterium]|nr:DUF502 domain-containing protein [Pirellulales bacterium]
MSTQLSPPPVEKIGRLKTARRAFRTAVFRGFAALLPPLMTVVILIWLINTTRYYMLEPVTEAVRETLVLSLADIRDEPPGAEAGKNTVVYENTEYRRLENGTWIPLKVYKRVLAATTAGSLPATGTDFYRRYIDLKYLNPYITIPVFLTIFILFLYLLGRLMTAGIGGIVMNFMEGGVRRLPLVRNVYSAAKQISDFFFAKPEFEFRRIVAVEHPRKGLWSVGFVTNEGLVEINHVINEPMVTVLVPYSPLPVTGITIVVRKSECIDLNITFDQACEFIVSCGVVSPAQRPPQLRSARPAPPEKK